MDPMQFDLINTVLVISSVLVGLLILGLGPIGRALGRRIDGRSAPQLAERGQQEAELEVLRDRVGELEERLDFAERLLAAGKRTDDR